MPPIGKDAVLELARIGGKYQVDSSSPPSFGQATKSGRLQPGAPHPPARLREGQDRHRPTTTRVASCSPTRMRMAWDHNLSTSTASASPARNCGATSIREWTPSTSTCGKAILNPPTAEPTEGLLRSLHEAGLVSGDQPRAFQQPWHAQAFALAVALPRAGLFTWPEWVGVLSQQIQSAPGQPDEDPDSACPPMAGCLGAIGRHAPGLRAGRHRSLSVGMASGLSGDAARPSGPTGQRRTRRSCF